MKTKEKINIHEGHRKRLRENILSTGLYNISDLHFLEYLLTFTIPRADTNPIAHALLKEFKSIKGIFEANYQSLIKIDGIGDKTARFLEFMPTAFFYYKKSAFLKDTVLETPKSIAKFIKSVLPPSQNEQFIIIALNKDSTLKNYKIFESFSDSFISLNKFAITEFLINSKAYYCIFAHTHPYSSCNPSIQDSDSFKQLENLTTSISVKMTENLILSPNEFYSFKKETKFLMDDIDYEFVKKIYE